MTSTAGSETIISYETAITWAKKLGDMKNHILARYPLEYSVKELQGIMREDNVNQNSAVLPLKINILLDGISGMLPLQMFKVVSDKLPFGYQNDNINFIVNEEIHKITAEQDWTDFITFKSIKIYG